MLALTAALGATPVSQSKLGVVVLGDDATSRAILAACPAVVVLPLPTNAAAAAQLTVYRQNCSGGIAIARVGDTGMSVDGTTVSLTGSIWVQQVQALAAAGAIDAVEGPSEPLAASPTALAAFWSSFADLINGSPLFRRPVVGALPTGMPGVGATGTNPFCPTADAMRLKTYSWWWSYHARSATMTTDLATELGSTLGFRQIRTDCTLAGFPLVITEAGPAAPRAWQATDDGWLAFLDAQLAQEASVQGAALASAGTGGIASLAPVQAAVLARLANPTPTDGGITDGGTDGGADSGRGSIAPSTPPIGGELNPSTNSGCSTGGPAFLMLALSPVLFFIRRMVGGRARARTR